MSTYQLIGVVMLVIMFGYAIIRMGLEMGWKDTIKLWLFVLLVTSWVLISSYLITNG